MDTSKIEYVKLWMEQSRLYWSRLQTATALHTGVLVGWYYLQRDKDSPALALFLLCAGILLSILILVIMWRDTRYMDAMRKKAGEDVFPYPKCRLPIGGCCGALIIIFIMLAELCLLMIGLLNICNT